MARITFELKGHSILPGRPLLEVRYGGELLCTIAPGQNGDVPELRIISKHPATTELEPSPISYVSKEGLEVQATRVTFKL